MRIVLRGGGRGRRLMSTEEGGRKEGVDVIVEGARYEGRGYEGKVCGEANKGHN